MSKLSRFKGLAGRAFEARTDGVGAEQDRGEHERAEPRNGTERMPGARLIPLDRLVPDPEQPRKRFSVASLEELAASLRLHGVLQPLLVSAGSAGDYRIVAGERRYRAAQLAGLDRVPCIVTTDLEAGTRLEQQLVENLQREGIAPLEECAALEALRERCGLTHQQVAERLGKSRTYVTKTLALRKLPDGLRAELANAGVVAREQLVLIAQQPDENAMWHLWRTIARGQHDVRSLRKAAKPAANRGERAQVGASVKLRAESSNAVVTIRFRRARIGTADIIRALEEAAADVHKRNRS